MSDREDRTEPQWERLTPSADTTTLPESRSPGDEPRPGLVLPDSEGVAQGQGTPRPDAEFARPASPQNTSGDMPDPDFGLDPTAMPDVAYGNTDMGGDTNTGLTSHQRHGLEGMAARGESNDEATTGGVLRGGDTTSRADTGSNLPHGMGDENVGGTLAQGTSQAPMGSGDVADPDPDTATRQSTFEQGMRGTAQDAPGRAQTSE